MLTITNFDQAELGRCASAMYEAGINWAGHRLSAIAALPVGTQIPSSIYDDAKRIYRDWLVIGAYPAPADFDIINGE